MFCIVCLRCFPGGTIPSDETRPSPSGGTCNCRPWAAACPQGFGVGRAAAPRAATRSGALGVVGENRTELGDRTGGGIGSTGSGSGTYRRTAAFSPVPSGRKSPRNKPAPPAAVPLRFGLLVAFAVAAGRPGRSGREGSGCRAGGAVWHGCHLMGPGLDRRAILWGWREAGRIAAGIHGTKLQDAVGRDHGVAKVGGMKDFRSLEAADRGRPRRWPICWR